MALSDLGIHCLDDPINQTLQNILIILRHQDFKNPDMSCRSVLALPLASSCSLPTVFKRLYCNILGLIHLVAHER
jgi:hypothetical protein